VRGLAQSLFFDPLETINQEISDDTRSDEAYFSLFLFQILNLYAFFKFLSKYFSSRTQYLCAKDWN